MVKTLKEERDTHFWETFFNCIEREVEVCVRSREVSKA